MTTWFPKRIVGFLLLLALIGAPAALFAHKVRQDRLDDALIAAINKSNTAEATSLLAQGADPDSHEIRQERLSFRQHLLILWNDLRGAPAGRQRSGPKALMLAVQQDNAPIVDALLACGATGVNAEAEFTNEYDRRIDLPLLLGAAQRGNLQMVQTLLNHGANIYATDHDGETALIRTIESLPELDGDENRQEKTAKLAARKRHISIANLLLARGVDVNVRDRFLGWTALVSAAAQDEPGLVDALLQKGADPNIGAYPYVHPGDLQWRALTWAAGNENVAMVRTLLLHGAKANIAGDRNPPMTVTSNTRILTLLLAAGADVGASRHDSKDQGVTPLTMAARDDNLAAVRLLVSHGADVNVAEDSGMTPLMFAAQGDDVRIVDYLLARGAHVNDSDGQGMTALMYAAGDGRDDNISALLDSGADVNLRENEVGATALMLAASDGNDAAVYNLLDAGANIKARDRQGGIALTYAQGNTAVISQLRRVARHLPLRQPDGKDDTD